MLYKPTSKFLIYCLKDPITGEVRYIGRSSSGLSRPKKHFYPSILKSERTRKNNWVRSLVRKTGLLPTISVLHECQSADELNSHEIEFISTARKMKYRLTNCTDGGHSISSNNAKRYRKRVSKEACRKGGLVASKSGVCARNNLKLRRPIIATNIKTGEQRWYLSASHAASDGLGSRSSISNTLRSNWRCKHNRGWTFEYVSK